MRKTYKEYDILHNKDEAKLLNEINEMAQEGWEMVGPIESRLQYPMIPDDKCTISYLYSVNMFKVVNNE